MANAKRPNILMIVCDQMRGDCMGVAGHPDVKTPYIDSLAMTGVRFDRASSACPSCVPARAILHTGLSQRHTGRVGYEDRIDWKYPTTLAGELTRAGYQTQCVGKMHVHPLRNHLGYEGVELHDGYMHAYRLPTTVHDEDQRVADDYLYWLGRSLGADITDTGLDCNGWVTRPWPWAEQYHPTNWVTDRSLDFLRRRDPTRPFFLTVSYVRPHAPCDPPQAYYDLYKDKPLRSPVMGDWAETDKRNARGRHFGARTGPFDETLVQQMLAGYYGCITHIDHQIGRLLIALIERRLLDDTVILFTSDHGDLMGDHALIQKSRPYQGSIHIPMILSGPERIIGEQGRCDGRLAELRDVMPTLLSVAGAPVPEGLDGESLLAPSTREYLHGEHVLPPDESSTQFILTKKDKYVWYSQTGREQYFDLEHDPNELHEASGDSECQARVAQLRALLAKELAGCPEGYSDGVSLTPNPNPDPVLPWLRAQGEETT